MATETLQATRCRDQVFHWGRRTYVMAVLNVTPDSFSGDGVGTDIAAAVAQAKEFAKSGADIIDIGAESTRPGASPITQEEELRRLLPTLAAVRRAVSLPISVDTYKSSVAKAALAAGADIVNDVWGLRRDPLMASVVSNANAPVILMHNQQGTEYRDLVPDVFASLAVSVRMAQEAGIPRDHILIDPGFGFGKTAADNLEILRRLDEFRALKLPLLIGTSRKSTIGLVLGLPMGERRIGELMDGTAATVAIAIAKGADMVRVHDVAAMARVARMSDAIIRGWGARA